MLGSFPQFLRAANGGVFFNAIDGTHQEELWFTNGSVARLTCDIAVLIAAARERVPDLEFVVAGARPVKSIVKLGDHLHITVTGEVVDMNEEIDHACVIVVPLRQGSGTRLKILETWSRALPVVTTSKGCQGLSIRPGDDLVLANRPADFIDRVAELLVKPKLREALGRNGFETARDRYAWSGIGQILRHSLNALPRRIPPARQATTESVR